MRRFNRTTLSLRHKDCSQCGSAMVVPAVCRVQPRRCTTCFFQGAQKACNICGTPLLHIGTSLSYKPSEHYCQTCLFQQDYSTRYGQDIRSYWRAFFVPRQGTYLFQTIVYTPGQGGLYAQTNYTRYRNLNPLTIKMIRQQYLNGTIQDLPSLETEPRMLILQIPIQVVTCLAQRGPFRVSVEGVDLNEIDAYRTVAQLAALRISEKRAVRQELDQIALGDLNLYRITLMSRNYRTWLQNEVTLLQEVFECLQ